MGHRRVRRRVVVGITVLVALGAGALVARRLWIHDTARSVGAEEALDRFHSGDSSTTIARSEAPSSDAGSTSTTVAPRHAVLPTPGVYRYATTGFEHIDVLGGTRHDYPAETYLTVTPEGCGVRLRWDILKERREEWVLCVTDHGIELQPTGGVYYHEFYGRGEQEDLRCDRGVVLVPDDDLAHEKVPLACTLNTAVWLPEWQVLGRELRTVAGAQQYTYHVRMTVEDPSTYFEHTVVDYWLTDTGLPVAMTATTTSKTDTDIIGDVVYDEQFTADLADLAPLR